MYVTAKGKEEEVVDFREGRHGRGRKWRENDLIYILIKFLKIKKRKRLENGACLLLHIFTSMVYESQIVHGML